MFLLTHALSLQMNTWGWRPTMITQPVPCSTSFCFINDLSHFFIGIPAGFQDQDEQSAFPTDECAERSHKHSNIIDSWWRGESMINFTCVAWFLSTHFLGSRVHFPGKEGLFGIIGTLETQNYWIDLHGVTMSLRLILASKCWPLLRIKKHWSKNQDGFIQNHGCLMDPHFLLIQECIVVTLIKPLMLMFHDFCWLSFGGHWRVATATICREKYTSQCTYDHRNSPVPTTLLLWFR